jgi:hypothetical protein
MDKHFGFVAILDALGVSNYKIEEALRFNKEKNHLLKELEKEDATISSMFQNIKSKFDFLSEHEYPKISISTFGDTIIICWPTETTQKTQLLAPFVFMWLERAIVLGLDHGILLRGSVSVGEYLIEGENTLLGPAIADASAWSEEADWFGVILTPHCRLSMASVFENSDTLKNVPSVINEIFCVKYPIVPLHQGNKELLVISWPFFYLLTERGKPGYVLVSEALSKFPIPKGVESKYENSLNFFAWYEKNIFPVLLERNPEIVKEKQNVKK